MAQKNPKKPNQNKNKNKKLALSRQIIQCLMSQGLQSLTNFSL